MIVQQADSYIKACMQAWLFCESCIHAETSARHPKTELIRMCHQCAQACFAVVCRIISKEDTVYELAFNCILHCRECQEECEKHWQVDDIRYCGEVCSYCAEKMKDIVIPDFCLN
jgi:hypothetical protein